MWHTCIVSHALVWLHACWYIDVAHMLLAVAYMLLALHTCCLFYTHVSFVACVCLDKCLNVKGERERERGEGMGCLAALAFIA